MTFLFFSFFSFTSVDLIPKESVNFEVEEKKNHEQRCFIRFVCSLLIYPRKCKQKKKFHVQNKSLATELVTNQSMLLTFFLTT